MQAYGLKLRHFIGLALLVSSAAPAYSKGLKGAKDAQRVRVQHAKELLGSHYTKSVVRTGEQIKKINQQIYKLTKEQLPKKYKPQSRKVAQAIIDESSKYGFDPIFLMAVIQGESSFRPEQKGLFGEIGLMQIKPDTAEWIGKKVNLKWQGAEKLTDPVTNIRYGAAYLSWLREKFDSHAQLYIAAYNMGQRNVKNALEKDVWPKDYPVHVMSRYVQYYTQLRDRAPAAKPARKLQIKPGHPVAAN